MRIVAIIPVFILLAIGLVLPFIVGGYVYRDAKRRKMNAILWVLVSAVAPAMIGLIVYLLVRGNYSDLRCPQCDAPVQEQYVVCPKCGTKLRVACAACATAVQPDWKVCPKCTQPLPSIQTDVHLPIRAKDTSIWRVLAIVIIIPVLFIAILAVNLSVSFSGGSSSFRAVTVEEYLEEMHAEGYATEVSIAGKVQDWMNDLEISPDHAYALRYDYSTESGNEYFFLIYVPEAGMQTNSAMGQSSSIFGTTLTLELQHTGNGGGLFNVVSSADHAPNLKIMLNGKRIPCDVTTVQYNPTLFYNAQAYSELETSPNGFLTSAQVTVVRRVNNHTTDTVDIEDYDLVTSILNSINSAPYLDFDHEMYQKADGSGGYEFTDGFDIAMEYNIQDGTVQHTKTLHCLVLEYQGNYYIIDDRPDEGRFIREIDAAFYHLLVSLFA